MTQIPITLSCLLIIVFSNNQIPDSTRLQGKWDASVLISYPRDTVQIESNLDWYYDKITIKTDSGFVTLLVENDSIIGTEKFSVINVAEFHFDDTSHGIISFYDLDISNDQVREEDPRFTDQNFSFSLYENENGKFILLDNHFNQFGRAIDTVEYEFITNEKLKIYDKTISRLE